MRRMVAAAAAAAEAAELAPGMQVQGYTIVRELGQGAHAVTFLVQVPAAHKLAKEHPLAAMKVPKNRVQMAATVQEAYFLNLLRTPTVVEHLETLTENGVLLLVTEYCAYGDLETWLARRTKPFGEEFVRLALMHLLLALHTCHSQRITHRDIKPANVLLNPSGVFKLADFGVGRLLVDTALTLAGTPMYMAPEMLLGQPTHLAGDVYSLGCLLYRLCMLKLPHEAEDLTSLKAVVKMQQQDRIPTDKYSQELVDLIHSMLNPDPETRPSVTELLNEPWIVDLVTDIERQAAFREHGGFLAELALEATAGDDDWDGKSVTNTLTTL